MSPADPSQGHVRVVDALVRSVSGQKEVSQGLRASDSGRKLCYIGRGLVQLSSFYKLKSLLIPQCVGTLPQELTAKCSCSSPPQPIAMHTWIQGKELWVSSGLGSGYHEVIAWHKARSEEAYMKSSLHIIHFPLTYEDSVKDTQICLTHSQSR